MSKNHSEHPTNHVSGDGWKPCPAGAIQAVADRQQSVQKQAAMGRRAVIGAVVLLIACGAAFLWPGGDDAVAMPGNGMTCLTVQEHAEAYVSGGLDEVQARQVAEHCEHCPACRRHIQSLRKVSAQDRSARTDLLIAMSR